MGLMGLPLSGLGLYTERGACGPSALRYPGERHRATAFTLPAQDHFLGALPDGRFLSFLHLGSGVSALGPAAHDRGADRAPRARLPVPGTLPEARNVGAAGPDFPGLPARRDCGGGRPVLRARGYRLGGTEK